MLGLKSSHVSKRGHRDLPCVYVHINILMSDVPATCNFKAVSWQLVDELRVVEVFLFVIIDKIPNKQLIWWWLKLLWCSRKCTVNQFNQSNPVLLKERVRIPRTRRAGGAAMLWRRLPLDGVGSCRLFFTDDLHDNLSWVPASDKPHTFKSCFTHSSQVFFGRPGPFLPGTGLDLTLFISPLERMTCPNHLSRRSLTRMARSHIPSLACSSSIDGSSDGLTPQIQRIIARSLRHSRWRAAEVMGQISVPCNIELRTLELNRRPLRSKGTGLDVSKGRFSRNLPQAHLHLAVAAAMQPPPALSMSPR